MKKIIHNSLSSMLLIALSLSSAISFAQGGYAVHLQSNNNFADGYVTTPAAAAGIVAVTVQANSNANEFVVEWDNWYNKWYNTSTPKNTETTFTWVANAGSLSNSQLNGGFTSGKFYTFQIRGYAYANRQAVVMETDNAPRAFHPLAATAFAGPTFVCAAASATINITLAGAKSPQERVFIRYAINGDFNNSKVVEAIGSGTTWSTASATVPASDHTAGSTINYYAYTTTAAATNTSDHDLITLRLGNNGGSNYSYTVNANVTYFADTDNDGFGDAAVTTDSCNGMPAGHVANNTDCDDADNTKNTFFAFFVDADGDGFGTGSAVNVCAVDANTPPAGYSVNNTDCNDAVAAINPGMSEVYYNGADDNCDGNLDEGNQITSTVLLSQCGTTLPTIGSTIYATNINNATAYRFEVTNTLTNTVQTIVRPLRWFTLTMLASHDYATTYSIRVEVQRNGVWLGYYGDSCLVSSPAILEQGGTGVTGAQCGSTLTSISAIIMTNNVGNATGYRFRVTNLTDPSAPNQVQELERPIRWFSLTMLPHYFYGTTYLIEVAVKTTGEYTAYGTPCQITTPAVPALTNCSQVVATSGTIVSTASKDKATSYRFELTNVTSGAITTLDRPLQWFRFNMFPGFAAGTEYAVRVAIMTSGAYSPYGDVCTVTAPGAAKFSDVKTDIGVAAIFKTVAYPNPFADTFALDVTTASQENVQVKVYDMIGKLLEVRDVAPTAIGQQQMGQRYPAGVYNVVVMQGNTFKSLRVIKR